MRRRPSWLVAAAGGLVLAVAVVVVGLVILRPSSTAGVGGVTVACEGIGSDEACGAWASELLADGPTMHTFDPEDLAHLRLTRPFLLPGECEVAYYVSRTLDEPVAREAVPCPAG